MAAAQPPAASQWLTIQQILSVVKASMPNRDRSMRCVQFFLFTLSFSLSLSLSVKVVKIGKLVDIYRTVGEKLNCDYIYSG